MKLIIAILQDEDAGEAISHLNEAGFQVTRLATNSKARTQYATLPSSCGAMHGFILAPIEVKVGGATVFVVDVEQFHKF